MLRVEPTGLKNGANRSYVLPQAAVTGGQTWVVVNGQLMQQVASAPTSTQCILSGTALTLGLAPFAEDDVYCFIQTTLGAGLIQVAITGLKNSSNTSYTIATAPPVGSSLMFFVNGIFLNEVVTAPTPSQMNLSGLTVTTGLAPAAADVLTAYIENAFSFIFLQSLPMTGSGALWTTALDAITGFSPLLMVFVNGQLQQEVGTVPTLSQFRHTETDTELTILLGLSLTSEDDLQVYVIGLTTSDVVVTVTPNLPLYLDMQNELLVLMNEQIDLIEAKMCLNRRWQKILNAWSWSFVKTEGAFQTRAPKSTGTLSVTEAAFFVIGTGTSFAASDIGAILTIGDHRYVVTDVQALGATQQLLRINLPYVGETAVGVTYQLVTRVYALDVDVVDIATMVGPQWAFEEVTQEMVDLGDARRQIVGRPAAYLRRGMTNGIYQVELWPVPDDVYTIHYTGLMRTVLTEKGQIIPDVAEVLLMAAEEMACGIVSSKRAAEKDYQGAAFWASKGSTKHGNYLESLAELKAKDRRRFVSAGIGQERGLSVYRDTPGYDVGW